MASGNPPAAASRSRFTAARLDKQFARRDTVRFIPRRCEGPPCLAAAAAAVAAGGAPPPPPASLKRCSKCTLVMYCGVACQRADWPRHKVECGHLQGLGLIGLPFDPVEELAHYPLGTQVGKEQSSDDEDEDEDEDEEEYEDEEDEEDPIGPDDRCGICGAQENLVRTECCNNILCDESDNYALFSYSRAFCARSHQRYTTCCSHYTEDHGQGDWRSCDKCAAGRVGGGTVDGDGRPVRSWFGTNGYNFTPMTTFPPGSMITTSCHACGRRVETGSQGYSPTAVTDADGTKRMAVKCLGCPRR